MKKPSPAQRRNAVFNGLFGRGAPGLKASHMMQAVDWLEIAHRWLEDGRKVNALRCIERSRKHRLAATHWGRVIP